MSLAKPLTNYYADKFMSIWLEAIKLLSLIRPYNLTVMMNCYSEFLGLNFHF